MARRRRQPALAKIISRNLAAFTRQVVKNGEKAARQAWQPVTAGFKAPGGAGDWISGIAVGPAGMRRFQLYRPPGAHAGERLPVMVMLHGCGQNAQSFAASTKMNRVAARERFLVLYPEQDRLSNMQGCWNWFDTRTGRAQGEAALIMSAIDQVCLLHGADSSRVAVAGLSAGASMAALLAVRYPTRFVALAMHSGIAPGWADSSRSAARAMRGQLAPDEPPDMTLMDTTEAWPALLAIQGSLDAVVSANNAQAAVGLWAGMAGARADKPREVQRGKRRAMSMTDYRSAGRLVATLALVQGLGHAWSGGAAAQAFSDPDGPDAARLIWTFSARRFRERLPSG
ncbi:extracellular catalytic domain type 1 short-chain-length polyhydroxyalkanoate depolymerase [Kerstersia gyiorum]|jgi:poly(hydroxyalkanoate) depolymerase family esterase|uniref:extracellular catalytic domain type 1 short-chain-length polyhydroxyalkanoate depolymerase n=1 Tax=Kerstersia gyiorum TaxID=206506 RepID=UPI00242E9E1B|nr:PHB depolymerase family esterase [Kerstersia gyiorum]MCH4272258.1 PHB depolymerase family esterase [Kerstersia gyiorum]MCI1228804.1 PHB depolymerase family esterase [Kerstersia gyiorum]